MEIGLLIQHIVFYVFTAVLLFSAAMVIVSRNPVHSVLYLVLCFFASSGLWILLETEFLALILLLVYVGAVMTLFLFVVMMLNLGHLPKGKRAFVRYLPYAFIIVLMIILMLLLVVGPETFGLSQYAKPAAATVANNNIKALGNVLYTDYVLPFELAAVILLVGIIAAISLTHRPSQNSLKQRPSDQIRVNPKDRVRLVKMKSEKQS